MTEEAAELQEDVVEPEITEEGETEDSQPSESEDTSAETKPKTSYQKRIDEITALRREAEKREADAQRDRDYWREQALKNEPKKEPEPEKVEGKPKLDDFSSYEDYTEALTDWKVTEALKGQSEAQKRAQAEAEKQSVVQSYRTRADSFSESHPDFDAVVTNPRLPVSEAMAEAAFTSEKGPELLYYLGTNPEEAHRISQLPPYQAAMEMGRLEAKFTSQPARNQSRAPDPLDPISPGGGNATVDPDKMSADQWRKWRESQIRK